MFSLKVVLNSQWQDMLSAPNTIENKTATAHKAIYKAVVKQTFDLQGHEVAKLMATNDQAAFSNFTYWVPAPPPPSPQVSGSKSILYATSSDQPDPISVMQM